MFDDVKKIIVTLTLLLLDTEGDGITDLEIERAGKRLIEILDEPGGIEVSSAVRSVVQALLPLVLKIAVRQAQKAGLVKR